MPNRPALYVVASICSLQIGAVFAVQAFDHLSPSGVAWARMLVAGGILLAVAKPRQWGRFDRRVAGGVACLAVALTLMHVAIYEAYDRLPIGIAATLEALGPLTLALALSRRIFDLLLASVALIGVVLITSPSGHPDAAGLLFGLGAGVCWAAYIVANRSVASSFSDDTGLVAALLAGAVLLTPIGVVAATHASTPEILVPTIAAVAVLSSAVPFALETRALRSLSAYTFAVLTSLYPAVGAAVGFAFLGQSLTTSECVGVALVTMASVGVADSRARLVTAKGDLKAVAPDSVAP